MGETDLELPSDPSAAWIARRYTRDLLERWHLQRALDPVLLVVSELVTNAFRHGGPPIRLRLLANPPHVRVCVHDGSPALPTTACPGSDAESGRGSYLVQQVTDAVGTEPCADGGKTLWADVPTD